MTTYLAAILAVEYAVAVVTRWRCLRLWPELRGWYHASIVCCVASSASFVWLVVYGDSVNRLVIVRGIQLILVPTGLIWPGVIGERTRLAEHRARMSSSYVKPTGVS